MIVLGIPPIIHELPPLLTVSSDLQNNYNYRVIILKSVKIVPSWEQSGQEEPTTKS